MQPSHQSIVIALKREITDPIEAESYFVPIRKYAVLILLRLLRETKIPEKHIPEVIEELQGLLETENWFNDLHGRIEEEIDRLQKLLPKERVGV